MCSTSAVGLLGGGLALTETDSGPLRAGEILWQGNIEDLVVQRVTVCRETHKQTLLISGLNATTSAARLWWTACDSPVPLPCSPAVCVGLSPSSPLGWKPSLAQSSMGLTWSSGLSDSQGGNVFSARILAICERDVEDKDVRRNVRQSGSQRWSNTQSFTEVNVATTRCKNTTNELKVVKGFTGRHLKEDEQTDEWLLQVSPKSNWIIFILWPLTRMRLN